MATCKCALSVTTLRAKFMELDVSTAFERLYPLRAAFVGIRFMQVFQWYRRLFLHSSILMHIGLRGRVGLRGVEEVQKVPSAQRARSFRESQGNNIRLMISAVTLRLVKLLCKVSHFLFFLDRRTGIGSAVYVYLPHYCELTPHRLSGGYSTKNIN